MPNQFLGKLATRLHIHGKKAQWRFLKNFRQELTLNTQQGRLSVATKDDEIGQRLFCYGNFQYEFTKNALSFLREKEMLPPKGSGTILDIGANNGVISIGMLRDGEFARTIGIEPDPRNVAFLKTNIGLNGLSDRYRVIAAAASDRPGEVSLKLSEDNFGDHQVTLDAAPGGGNFVTVPAAPLDDLLSEVPEEFTREICLAWIDVQGHEGYVFAGAQKLFSSDLPIVTEFSPAGIVRSGTDLDGLCRSLAELRRYFWVWRRSDRFVRYPIADLPLFCEELGMGEHFDDVILTN